MRTSSTPAVPWEQHRTEVRLTSKVRRVGIYLLLIGGGLMYAVPFLWMLSTSLKEPADAIQIPPIWFPYPLMWGNYIRAWTVLPFFDFTRNSVVYVIASLVGELLSCSLVAFGFARLPFRGRSFWFAVVLSTMMLPSQVTLIPQL